MECGNNNKLNNCKLAGLCCLLTGLLLLVASHTVYVSGGGVDGELPEIQQRRCLVVKILDGMGIVCILSSIVLFTAGSVVSQMFPSRGTVGLDTPNKTQPD